MAPGWMAMLKSAHCSAGKPRSSVARIRCPVEETGRYSVSPSTMPRMMITNKVFMLSVGLLGGEAAAAAIGGEPAFGDRAHGRRCDAEGAKSLGPVRNHIVALKHQPLVPGDRSAGKPADRCGNDLGDGIGDVDERAVAVRGLADPLHQLAHRQDLGSAELVGLAAV